MQITTVIFTGIIVAAIVILATLLKMDGIALMNIKYKRESSEFSYTARSKDYQDNGENKEDKTEK